MVGGRLYPLKSLVIVCVLFGIGWGQYVFLDGEFLRDISPIRKIVLSPTFETDSVIAVAGEDGWMLTKLPHGPLETFYTGEPVQDLVFEGQRLLLLTASSLQMFRIDEDAAHWVVSRIDSMSYGGIRLIPFRPFTAPDLPPAYLLARGQNGTDLLVWDTTAGFVVDNHYDFPTFDLALYRGDLVVAAGEQGTYLVDPQPSGGAIIGHIAPSYTLPNHQKVHVLQHYALITGIDIHPPFYPLQAFDIQEPESPHLVMTFPTFQLSWPIISKIDSFFCVVGSAQEPNATFAFRLYRITGGDSIVQVYETPISPVTTAILRSPTQVIWSDNRTVYFGKPGRPGHRWFAVPQSIQHVQGVSGGILAMDVNGQLYYGATYTTWGPYPTLSSFTKSVIHLPEPPVSVTPLRTSIGNGFLLLDAEGGLNLYAILNSQELQWVSRPFDFPQAYGPIAGDTEGRAYLATDGHTVTVMSLWEIEQPEILATVTFSDSIVALAGIQTFLGVGFANGTIKVFSWTDPSSPQPLLVVQKNAHILDIDYHFDGYNAPYGNALAVLFDDASVLWIGQRYNGEIDTFSFTFPVQPIACSYGNDWIGAAAGEAGYYMSWWGEDWFYPAHGNALDVEIQGVQSYVAMGPFGVASLTGIVKSQEEDFQSPGSIRLASPIVRSQVILQGDLEPGVIEIFDVAGRRMIQWTLTRPQSSVTIRIASWPTGVYLLRYSGHHSPPITQKFLKIQ